MNAVQPSLMTVLINLLKVVGLKPIRGQIERTVGTLVVSNRN